MILSTNSVTILNELEVITLDRKFIYYNEQSSFNKNNMRDIGKRIDKIMRGIDNLIDIITSQDSNSLYLILKIEL